MAIVFDGTRESYVERLSEFLDSGRENAPEWVADLRREAISGFGKLGFPTLSDEEWRFTNLEALRRCSFSIAENGISDVSKKTVDSYGFPGLDCLRLVFVNGRFASSLSDGGDVGEGIVVKSLSGAIREHGDLVREHFAKYADYEKDAFISLNTSYFEDGVFVYVPDRTVFEKPVHVLHVSVDEGRPLFINPRNLIIVGQSSEAKVIEHYVSLSQSVYFSNAVTEVICGEDANLEHYRLEFESQKAFNFSTLRVNQQKNSNIASHSVLYGGAIVRNNVHPVLAGEGCNSDIYGLFISEGRQHMDNFMRVEHASPHCDSRQFYNGVLDGRSKGVFHGRILVHEGAEKTDAKQTNRNLLLSDTAQIDTKPQLEIYNDDVKCTHGATIGQMDEEALFYLCSRGIPMRKAKIIMLRAFTNETLEHMSIDSVRETLENVVMDWFERRLENGGGG
ncbi:MAG: Fe-S cluster assembly protein SufD [Candidatus Dadabacteria bacterium]|nr:Fe-S cluster assembly protein SufD [Candidatus Dadabacteria bacterium]MYA48023.1 Fe-S cluster assembly protein SufD [Candidatus Dadabacteria bacterium]MYF48299.1 Fe-S cluster assembly protein SufD [Candidatus Dadabacteria bacterium]MYG82544.1 Fe-S cluster assembly protein SufD [Candidatus Dadabacteria bacterium]MYK49039.1 Fe-S cluster assembly protein SufD [Candidatus Dadabacteria bacterium]